MPELAEIETMLAEIAPDAPCGPDLEYDPEFMMLEKLAAGKPERQFGDTIIPAEEPDWHDVRERAESLLARTKDLRVAAVLVRALTRTEDIPGLRKGLTLIVDLLDRYWDCVHPLLDPQEGNDPTARMSALQPLADPITLPRDVRNAFVLCSGRQGLLSVRDILLATGKISPASGESLPSQASVEEIIRSAAEENTERLNALHASIEIVGKLQSLLADRVGADRAPDLSPLADLLKTVAHVCAAALGSETGETAAAAPAQSRTVETVSAANGIQSREDAIRMLERVCEYLDRTEPANPAPLLIRRAQHLIKKNFLEIIQDLAPDSLGQIKKIAGLEMD